MSEGYPDPIGQQNVARELLAFGVWCQHVRDLMDAGSGYCTRCGTITAPPGLCRSCEYRESTYSNDDH